MSDDERAPEQLEKQSDIPTTESDAEWEDEWWDDEQRADLSIWWDETNET